MLGQRSEDKLISCLGDMTVDADQDANQILTEADIAAMNAEPTIHCLSESVDELGQKFKTSYGFIDRAPTTDLDRQKHDECRRRLRATKALYTQRLLASKREEFFMLKAEQSKQAVQVTRGTKRRREPSISPVEPAGTRQQTADRVASLHSRLQLQLSQSRAGSAMASKFEL